MDRIPPSANPSSPARAAMLPPTPHPSSSGSADPSRITDQQTTQSMRFAPTQTHLTQAERAANLPLTPRTKALQVLLEPWVREKNLSSEKLQNRKLLVLALMEQESAIPVGNRIKIEKYKLAGLDLSDLPSCLTFTSDINAVLTHWINTAEGEKRVGREIVKKILIEQNAQLTDQGITVDNDFEFFRCNYPIELPDHLIVNGELSFEECEITTLQNLHADCLEINNCSSFQHLNNCFIKGDLKIYECENFRQLTEGISIGGKLEIIECRRFCELPEAAILIGSDIDFRHCNTLRFLPNWIYQLGPVPIEEPNARQQRPRMVGLEYTGFSEASLNQIQEINPDGMEFIFNMPAGEPTETFNTIPEALYFWFNTAGIDIKILNALQEKIPGIQLDDEQTRDLTSFLSRLTATAEFQNSAAKIALAKRVVTLIRALVYASHIKATLLDQIHDALSSCDDRVIFQLNKIMLAIIMDDAEQNSHPEQALRNLAPRIMKLNIVHQQAQLKCESLTVCDPIEVYLAYEINLAEKLELPIETRNMIFENLAQVTKKDLEKAEIAALEAVDSEDKINAFLKDWHPWQKLLRKNEAADFIQKKQWAELQIQHVSGAIEDSLTAEPITAEDKPVGLESGESIEILSLNSFFNHWIEHGENPFTKQKIDLGQLKQVKASDDQPAPKKQKMAD